MSEPDADVNAADVAAFVNPPDRSPFAGLEATFPLFAFVILNGRVFGLFADVGSREAWFGAAVAASVALSIRSLVARRRRGLPYGRFIPIVTAWLVIRGLIGVITGNEDIFFGLSIAAKVAIGIALLVSVAIGRSIGAYAAPWIFGFSDEVQAHPSYRSAMAVITVIAAVYEFISAGFDVWLLFIRDASANEFVIIRYIVNWGASSVAVFGALWYLGRRLRDVPGFPGLMAIFEAHVEAQAERMGWDIT